MDIKQKIEEILSRLTWQIEHEQGERDLEITSDPWSRTHIIRLPVAGPEWRDIEYLHELAHATLAERHHLLATAFFAIGTEKSDMQAVTNAVRCASDWYADDLLMQWVPDEEAAEILEHAEYGIQFAEAVEIDNDEFSIMALGQSLAQAVKYLKWKRSIVPKIYYPTIDILLSVDPGKPTVQGKRNLINALAALTCRQRVHLAHEDGMDVWRIKK